MPDETTQNAAQIRDLLIETARWSRVAERNGDLHARIASALADDELGRESSAAGLPVGERQGRQPAQAASRRLTPAQSRKIARDMARVAFRNGEWRLALAVLIWPSVWSHTRQEADRA